MCVYVRNIFYNSFRKLQVLIDISKLLALAFCRIHTFKLIVLWNGTKSPLEVSIISSLLRNCSYIFLAHFPLKKMGTKFQLLYYRQSQIILPHVKYFNSHIRLSFSLPLRRDNNKC